MNFLDICIILLVLFMFISLVIYFCPEKKKEQNNLEKKGKKNIDKQLTILSSDTTPKKKARAFAKLIQYSYVLIHTLINEGNKYHDNKQIKHFCDSLTSKNINKLLNLEGNGNNE